MRARSVLFASLLTFPLGACADDSSDTATDSSAGDGDGDDSDASGSSSSGDGDGDPGDGDGDPGDGDGDGDPGDGDGDGDPGCVGEGGSCAEGQLCCDSLMCCEGVPVPPGQEFCGGPCPMSDRNLKRDFAAVDTNWVLERLVALPISTWTYKDDEGRARHIGPMAQDFRAAFEVGASERYIFQVDGDGAAFAAIQALDAKVEELESENRALRSTLAKLEARLDALER